MIRTGGFTHVHLVVHDIERSAAFYRDALELRRCSGSGRPGVALADPL
jgi:catechol 2,3-dioxygenase-like lactoylglutathione lyase family enzyme